MDSPIQLLEHTDQATKQMLENVRKRKDKFENTKKWHYFFIYITLFFSFFFCIYFYFNIAEHYSFLAMLSAALNDSFIMLLLAMTLIGLGAMNVLKQQKEKKEKEYQELRCEIVDRSKDLWKREEEWRNRHIVFELMKKQYDINLYHEKK